MKCAVHETWLGRVLAIAMVVNAGCGGAEGVSPSASTSATASTSTACTVIATDPGGGEPEVFGIIYENGVRSCTSWPVSLSPEPQTAAYFNRMSYMESSAPTWNATWGWWDPLATDGPCIGARQNEVHLDALPGKEQHCVRPGQYQLTIEGPVTRSIPLDYVAAPTNVSDGSATLSVEVPGYDSTAAGYHDAIVNADFRTSPAGYTSTPVLRVDAASLLTAGFSPVATPSGNALKWFRFDASRSTTNSPADGTRGSVLARLYYDCNATQCAEASGYYNIRDVAPSVVRVRRFPNPPSSAPTRQVTVKLELLRQDEQPQSSSRTGPFAVPQGAATTTITITRKNPNLIARVPSPGASTVVQGNSLQVNVSEEAAASDTVAVDGPWTGRVYLSSDPAPNPSNGVLIGTFVHNDTIAGGATNTDSPSFPIPTTLSAGTYRVVVALDDNHEVTESSEIDNVAVSTATVTVTAPPPTANITSFNASVCQLSTSGSTASVLLGWSFDLPAPNTAPAGSYQIFTNTMNDPTGAALVTSGAFNSTGSQTFRTPFYSKTGYRYFWIQAVNGSSVGPKIENSTNPLFFGGACRTMF